MSADDRVAAWQISVNGSPLRKAAEEAIEYLVGMVP